MKNNASTSLLLLICVMSFLISCTETNSNENKIGVVKHYKVDLVTDTIITELSSEDSITFKEVLELSSTPEFTQTYKKPVFPIDFKLTKPIEELKLFEIELKIAEIKARKGAKFDDPYLDAFFRTKKWYQPITWDSTYQVKLDKDEKEITKLLEAQKKELASKLTVKKADGAKIYDIEKVYNYKAVTHFDSVLYSELATKNFVFINENQQSIKNALTDSRKTVLPNFITTDFIGYFVFEHIKAAKEDWLTSVYTVNSLKLFKALKDALKVRELEIEESSLESILCTNAKDFVEVSLQLQSLEYKDERLTPEINRIKAAKTKEKSEIFHSVIDYSMFKTNSNEILLKKWLENNVLPFEMAFYLAKVISSDTNLLTQFEELRKQQMFWLGKSNSISLDDVIKVILDNEDLQNGNYDIKQIREKVLMKYLGSQKEPQLEKNEVSLTFFPKFVRYEKEIFEQLTHVSRTPTPLRPLPKSLDLMAVLGSKEATKLLSEDYKEITNWKDYSKNLDKAKQKTLNWEDQKSLQILQLNTCKSLFVGAADNAAYAQDQLWKSKRLNTAISLWSATYTSQYQDFSIDTLQLQSKVNYNPEKVFIEQQPNFYKSCIGLLTNIEANSDENSSKVVKENTEQLLLVLTKLVNIVDKQIAKTSLEIHEKTFITNLPYIFKLKELPTINWNSLNEVYSNSFGKVLVGKNQLITVIAVNQIQEKLYITKGFSFLAQEKQNNTILKYPNTELNFLGIPIYNDGAKVIKYLQRDVTRKL